MLNKIFIVSKYTFKQLLKSKILYISLMLGLAIMVVTYVATEFTYGVPEKVALDFGLGMLSLSSIAIALFMGATLLPNEIDSRTVYMVISRPVPRWVFITGKLLGLISVLVVNVIILSALTLICSWLLGGAMSELLLLTILFNILESTLLLLVVVFFSLFTNSILAASISTVLFVLGHAVRETQNLLFVEKRTFLKTVLEVYHLVLPGFYKLNLKDLVIYNHTLDLSYTLYTLLYAGFYSLFLFLMIIYTFNKKNLD